MKVTYNPYETGKSILNLEGDYQIKSLLLEGEWNNEVYKFIEKNNILGLYFNFVKGSNASNFDFLEYIKNFQLLNIISCPIDNLDQIKYFSDLKVLSLQCHINRKTDFSNLKNLEKCFMNWVKGAESIFNCEKIKFLTLDSFKSKFLPENWICTEIEQLDIYKSDLTNLEKLKTLRKLKKLSLFDCKNLNDISSLECMENLQWLTIDGSKLIENYNSISNLKQLKILNLSNTGKIPSIEFIKNLNNLKGFAFAGSNTFIEDGNLKHLTNLNKLSMLMFSHKKHYTHKLLKNWNWENYDFPDVLLKENK
ncbi:hypothetical protein CH372_18460 [Leptospira meyeri]|uniref:hypothetical protein n=1 Tax=Leptospira meyeri TaxID=29508 RepID=UPI000C2A7ED3|nr:hypothetical protein [Leptospira meyeri]PKA10625.1 hypothetical protein CH372_18460 [Leptospira meyeri]PKA23938.1 hypothetical protein CH381_23050 [Leptospira sp. mixed culture ATI2-C-A1]